jgi:hypothetical protein
MTACLNDFLLRAGWRPDANRTRRFDLALQGHSRAVEPFVVQPKSFLTGGHTSTNVPRVEMCEKNFFQRFPLRITSADFWKQLRNKVQLCWCKPRFCGKSKAEKCVLQWTPASFSADTVSLRMRTLKCVLSISHPDGRKRVARPHQRLRGARPWLGEEREGRRALLSDFIFRNIEGLRAGDVGLSCHADLEAPSFVSHSDHDECLTRSKTGECKNAQGVSVCASLQLSLFDDLTTRRSPQLCSAKVGFSEISCLPQVCLGELSSVDLQLWPPAAKPACVIIFCNLLTHKLL